MPATTQTSIAPGRRRRFVVPNSCDPLGLFGDGPPWWTISKGKAWQRPSATARQAKKQRQATVFKLRWHAKHAALLAGNPTPTSLAAMALADKLATERGLPGMHPSATTMVRARAAAAGPAWISSSGAVVGAGMRDDPGGLPQHVRHRQVSRGYPASAEGMWDRPLQTGTRCQLGSCRRGGESETLAAATLGVLSPAEAAMA